MNIMNFATPIIVIVAVGVAVTACAPQYNAPQQVQTTAPSNPTVTYKYGADQELIQANQSAATFCNQYQSSPRTKAFSTASDGGKQVMFECVQDAAMPMPAQYNPNLAYNYMSDQELVDASRNAQIYCRNSGSQQVSSNVTTNANGSRTVTFQCGPR